MSRATPATKHAQRLDWLRAHPALLAQLPGVTEDITRKKAEALDTALRGLTLVRLFAVTAAPESTRWQIRLLVSELRGQPVSDLDRRWALRGEL